MYGSLPVHASSSVNAVSFVSERHYFGGLSDFLLVILRCVI